MDSSNSDIIVLRNPKGRYTDTIGIFKREDTKKMELDFIRTMNTNQGPIDEYELILER